MPYMAYFLGDVEVYSPFVTFLCGQEVYNVAIKCQYHLAGDFLEKELK